MPLPARSSAVTFDAVNKINDQNLPPANQPLNWDNTKLAPGVSDVAALGLVSPRAWFRITLAATTGAMVLISNWSVWSNATSTLPVLAHVGSPGSGQFTITLPTVVSDEYDASFNITNNIPVNLSGGLANIEGANFDYDVNVSATANVVTLNTGLANDGSPNDMVGITVFIVVY